MGKGKKVFAGWKAVVWGTVVAELVYLSGIALLALAAVKEVLPESVALVALAVWCFLSVLLGSVVTVRVGLWKPFPAAMLTAALFAAIAAVTGSLSPEGLFLGGRSIVLLGCMLLGGFAAAATGRRKKRKGKRR